MKWKKFGSTGETVSALGLGCMGMSTAYGTQDNEESIATLNLALELEINFWDTADCYGNGANERLISEVLVPNRDKVFLATKLGFVLNEGFSDTFQPGASHLDGSPKHVKEAAERSLKNLGVDTIDLLYLHRVDPNIPVEETVGAMAGLVKEGKVRYIGLSECTTDDLRRANAVHPIAAVQSEYSILTRAVEENGILALTQELGIAFVPFAPMSRGLITNKLDIAGLRPDDFRSRLPRYTGEYLSNNLKLSAAFAGLAQEKNATAAQLAIAWVMAQGEHIIPIPGTKRRTYLKENAGAAELSLTADDLANIQALLETYPLTGPRYSANEDKFVKK